MKDTKIDAISAQGECGRCGSADSIAAAKPLGRTGKKMAGRLLDGRTWDGVPT